VSGDILRYYGRDGMPITLEQWATRTEETKRVAQDDVATPGGRLLWVSTVWLGIDMGFNYGPPLIFETMVFEHGAADELCHRYATEDDALAGHAEIVHAAREGLLDVVDDERNDT
jgi:hypothetical protein